MTEKLNTRQYVKQLVETHGRYAPIPVYVLTLGELDALLDTIPEAPAEAPEITELVAEPYNPKYHEAERSHTSWCSARMGVGAPCICGDAPHPDICTTDTMHDQKQMQCTCGSIAMALGDDWPHSKDCPMRDPRSLLQRARDKDDADAEATRASDTPR
jgi:hypothetical protein